MFKEKAGGGWKVLISAPVMFVVSSHLKYSGHFSLLSLCFPPGGTLTLAPPDAAVVYLKSAAPSTTQIPVPGEKAAPATFSSHVWRSITDVWLQRRFM